MQLTSERHTRLADEISIVPGWAWGLAVVAFAAAQVLMHVVVPRDPNAPPLWGRILLGLLAGAVLGGYLLLLGYVNRDAGRRGMSRVLWTAVAILVPNGLGVVLYFILRQPILGVCPSCASPVLSGFNYCPKCNFRLSPSCPQCQHIVRADDTYCANCGAALARQDSSVPRVQSGTSG
ncbi:MAG: zinc ribbon domain-containing protein [Terriglobales bacterium]